MTVTRQVIEDLLPLYEANEASPDTRRLVEDYLALHPDMHTGASFTLPKLDPPDALERRALEHTQKWLALRNWILGLAIGFNLMPLASRFRGRTIDFLLYRDLPWLAVAAFVVAALFWFAFAWTSRRLADTGLRQDSWWTWFLGGVGASTPLVLAVSEWTGHREPITTSLAIGFIAGCLGVWSGRVSRPNY